jgi:Polyketide cyclase / dehydrase and lipid transport
MRVAVEQQIECSPEAAFDLMADASGEPEWNSNVTRAEQRSDGPIAAGAQFAIVNRGDDYDLTITTYDRPVSLEFRATGSIELVIRHAFAARDGGTHMTAAYDFRPSGPLKVVFAVMKPVIARSVRTQLASFKALCERSTSA